MNTKKHIEKRSNSEIDLIFQENQNKELFDIETEESIN